MGSPLIIFSDSGALIADIQWVFRDKLDFISSSSADWLMEYLRLYYVKLLIADMDMKQAFQTEVLEGLREFSCNETSFLFLISEERKLELEESSDSFNRFPVSADWLVKPFSRNTLISSVLKACR